MILRHEGHAERVSPKPIGRHQDVEEAMFRGASRAKRSFTRRKRAGRGYMCLSPVWKRAASAALNIAACAEAKPYATHSAINTIPLQSQGKLLCGVIGAASLSCLRGSQAVLIKL